MPSEPTEFPSDRRSGPIAGILLAAGTSSRMGRNKLLFRLDDESLLRRAARRALAGGVSPLIVVLGHQAELARLELADLPCRVVENPDFEQGITTSLYSGISAVPPEAPGAIVILTDMPLVTAEMIAALLTRFRGSTAPLVLSAYDGVQAPPMVYGRALFPELLALRGGSCGKQVVKRHGAEAEVLAWPAEALQDIDVPEDFARVQAG